MQNLQIDVSYSGNNDEIAIIKAKGYIDTITTQKIEKILINQIALKKYKLIVNLEKVSYINSSGWGAFLREIKEIRKENGDLVLVNMSPDVYSVFETMEFSNIFKYFDSVEAALKNFT